MTMINDCKVNLMAGLGTNTSKAPRGVEWRKTFCVYMCTGDPVWDQVSGGSRLWVNNIHLMSHTSHLQHNCMRDVWKNLVSGDREHQAGETHIDMQSSRSTIREPL